MLTFGAEVHAHIGAPCDWRCRDALLGAGIMRRSSPSLSLRP
jgi:hypothetical protein